MAQDRTSNFDMLVQISETELNTQLATQFLAGTIPIPPSMAFPVNTGGLSGRATLNFGTPVVDLDRPRPRMGLTLPFANSQLQLTAPAAFTLAPLGGTITIVDTVEMVAMGTDQIARMDFNAGAPTVTVVFDAATQAVLAPALAAARLTVAQAQNLMAGIMLTHVQRTIQRIDLTPPIPVVDDDDPVTIFDIDVTTVNDMTAADRDCLAFGLRMANDSGGNINNVTTSFIPAGSPSMVMMSNFWLLARVMRRHVADALGTDVSNFDTPLRLNTSIPAPGGQGTLTALEARVEGSRIRVDGRATDSGTAWSATSDFTFFVDLAFAGGAITVTATVPTVSTDVDLELWVVVLSLGLGSLFYGIVGVIVAAIVLAIVEGVAEGVANGLVAGGIGGALTGIAGIPLGPIGGGLALTSIILDDLELRGSLLRSVTVPVKSQGSYASSGAFAADLDEGTITASAGPSSDLRWDPSTGLSTHGAARLTVTGTPYGALSPVDVSRLPLSTTHLAPSLMPLSPRVGVNDVVFGLRTGAGRYAKARASRDSAAPSALHLDWVTYDTAVPRLDLAGRWSIVQRGEPTEYVTADCSFCVSTPVARCGAFEAWPTLTPFPVDYQWCLCGTVLKAGEGRVQSGSGPLEYMLEGRRLCVRTKMAQAIECDLCVSVIDARGSELFSCIQLSASGTETTCRKCVSSVERFEVETLPGRPELEGWRPLLLPDVLRPIKPPKPPKPPMW